MFGGYNQNGTSSYVEDSFQLNILPKEYKKHQIKTIRWKLYNIAGRIVYHSRKLFLKVRNYAYSIFKEIRRKTWIFCCNSS